MQASESKGTLDSVCWEAAHVHPMQDSLGRVFFFPVQNSKGNLALCVAKMRMDNGEKVRAF